MSVTGCLPPAGLVQGQVEICPICFAPSGYTRANHYARARTMLEHSSQYHPQTAAIRCGHRRTAEREHNEPIFTTSSFIFDNAAQAAALFKGDEQGNVYSRFTNPTVSGFENRLAAMEGGRFGLATASGMAAISGLLLGLLKAGDHVVASAELFGSTVSVFSKVFNRFGIETTFVTLTDVDQWQAAIRPNTRLLFLESPSNPLCEIADVKAIAAIAGSAGVLLAVDNAFCTPVMQRPLELGADIVVHTATKYLDGQGRCVGGALVTNDEEIYDDLFAMLRTTGPCMSPFNAWVFSKGLETLALRMKQHCDNAMQLASWLAQHPAVEKVYYPGLKSHPQHELAKRQHEGFGGIVAFEVNGGQEQAWQVIDSTRFLSITANLGDVKTTITHPTTTTHARISAEERARAGINENLIRVSAGLEHIDDIITDLQIGLDKVGGVEPN
jgi:O-succinylhomoserine sulfhydrylase